MKLLLLLLSITISSILAYDKETQTNGDNPKADIFQTNMDFAFKMYRQLSSRTSRAPPNLCFSPVSVSATLSMLALGAKSKTRKNILQGLGLDPNISDKDLHGGFQTFLRLATQETAQTRFQVLNEIFLPETANILPKYKKDLTYFYNASVQSVSFGDPKIAEDRINELVKDQTGGKVDNLVSNLDAKTMMVLIDYANLQGKWETPFQAQDTVEGNFTVNGQREASVKMMHQTAKYKTFRDKERKCKVVEVPYDDSTVLLLIIPKLGELDTVERSLTPKLVKEYLRSTRTSLVDFSMPRLTISTPFDIKYALLNMEIVTMFSSDNADFSGISNKPKLRVSQFSHQSSVDITEADTGAAAASASQVLSDDPNSNPKLRADRPFLFLLYRKDIEAILLIGRYMDPASSA